MFDLDEIEAPEASAEALWDALSCAADDSLDVLAQLDPGALSSAAQRQAVRRLERMRRSLDAAEGHLLAQLATFDATERSDGLATSRWLAREAKLPAGVARQRVRVAKQLSSWSSASDGLELVPAALSAAQVGFEHARVFAEAINDRNAEAIAPFISHLLDAAAHTRFERWRSDVHALAELLDPDGPEPDDLTRNRLTFSPTNGYSMLRGELHGECDLITRQAIDTVADELFRQFSRDREQFPDQQIPPRATLRALALVEICRRANATDVNSTRPPRPDATIIIHTDPSPEDPASPVVAPTVTDPTGAHVPLRTAAFLLCAAATRILTVTPDGQPIAETPSHDPTRSQRRGLAERDGGCTFPGCGAPVAWCDAHHAEPYPAGPTELHNLCLLCRHHHRVAHRHGWTVTIIDGWTRWTNPTGTTRWGQRHFRQRGHHQQRAGP